MVDPSCLHTSTSHPGREVYPQHANPAFEAVLATRTAAQEAAFFLPYLRPGMRVLDVGCGPGTITLGLAAAVTPGAVVGIDLQPSQVEQAQVRATAQTITNVRFEVADVYQLPFPDHAFDAAFAHAVLMHLREPVRALVELRRVLRPGGIIGVRDEDWGGWIHVPTTPLLEQWVAMAIRVRQYNGSDPYMGRHHRRLLLEAGYVRAEATASVGSMGSHETTRHRATFLIAQWQGFARTALAQGWVEQATVEAITAEIDAWAQRPDAFSATLWCAAVGWVGH